MKQGLTAFPSSQQAHKLLLTLGTSTARAFLAYYIFQQLSDEELPLARTVAPLIVIDTLMSRVFNAPA